ncbi:DinB family protein [Tenacibaculum pacificus]|uniref:DinB family protein n=1 Tax=Tenacibaculum pacificus TaxID=3018314 RepID=UPI0022F38638|nr:DinB family protein [Tenacibaculum pacificus]WBX73586.1 DinB family protein [Tenacibaculum pacificus]
MNKQFEILKRSREIVLRKIDGLSIEQLHKTPEGFKNNIAWNLAHLVVTQQLLQYKLSGLNCLVSDELIENYRKGTFPTDAFSEEDLEEVKELFIGLPDTLQEDFEAGIFTEYTTYETSTGFTIDSIESAIAFNNLHEGIHLGIILALVKLV